MFDYLSEGIKSGSKIEAQRMNNIHFLRHTSQKKAFKFKIFNPLNDSLKRLIWHCFFKMIYECYIINPCISKIRSSAYQTHINTSTFRKKIKS